MIGGRRAWPAYAAAGVAFAFAVVSVYWGAGGTAGLGTLGGTIEAQARARDHAVVVATWGAAVLKALGAVLALALVRPWGTRLPRRALLGVAAAGSVVLVLYGVSQTVGVVLIDLGVLDNPAGLSAGALKWRTFLWEPWFLVWGVLLGLATWRFRQSTSGG